MSKHYIRVNTTLLYFRTGRFFILIPLLLLSFNLSAQRATNSVLVNFGRESCDGDYNGSDITLISDAEASAHLLLQCNTDAEIGTIFSKFISYNAINNKLYVNDITDYTNSNIYILNVGLPANCTCPTITGVNYTIPDVVLSQFEFDNLGDLYALSNYDPSTGIGNIGAYDDTTGDLQSGSLKTVYFPSGHYPSDVGNGDLVIIPNGRMFCIFGGDTSKLFEITNYSKTVGGDATATYLGSPTKVCYAMAYDNGYLVMGGTDLGGYCYSFGYNIASGVLSDEMSSPLDDMPIDATSFSPSVAVGMRIVSGVQVDPTHWDLTYQIYIKNLGNVKNGNIQLTDDLESVFGTGNVSNVATSFISNGAGLTLNGSYDGVNNNKILTNSQIIQNYPSTTNSSLIQLRVTVANPIPDFIYYNSAIFSGKIGKDSTQLTVSDSSNNYVSSFGAWDICIDPNKNNVADDPGEGIPTPWEMGMILPIELSDFAVEPTSGGALLDWTTLSEKDNKYFVIERSVDALRFDSVGIVSGSGTSTISHDYAFFDGGPPFSLVYYRLREVNSNGGFTYSEVKVIDLQTGEESSDVDYLIYPNPAKDFLVLSSSATSNHDAIIEIGSVYGLNMFTATVPGSELRQKVPLPDLPAGYYIVSVSNSVKPARYFKIFINH